MGNFMKMVYPPLGFPAPTSSSSASSSSDSPLLPPTLIFVRAILFFPHHLRLQGRVAPSDPWAAADDVESDESSEADGLAGRAARAASYDDDDDEAD